MQKNNLNAIARGLRTRSELGSERYEEPLTAAPFMELSVGKLERNNERSEDEQGGLRDVVA